MDFFISGKHTSARQFAALAYSAVGSLGPPRKGSKMITTQEDSVVGKADALRCSMDSISKLTRRMAAVTTKLIHLAGSRFDMKHRIRIDGLVNRSVDDRGMCGAYRIDT